MSPHYVTVRDLRSHRFHWFMTAATLGLWSPVLLVAWAKGRRVLVP